MDSNFFNHHLSAMKMKFPTFQPYQDYHVFTFLCIRYFYYLESGEPFDQDIVEEYLTDGANDGGIDAIFNDPTSENNDVVVVQSKFYEKTPLTSDVVIAELFKINESLNKLKQNKIADFNHKVITAYRNATSNMEDNGVVKVVFFTSYQPKNKNERNKLEKSTKKYFPDYEVEMYYHSDIEAQIEQCDNTNTCVDYDKIAIDRKDNYLQYEDSVIVNVSALSLQDLYTRRRNGLLGLNLRYYVKNKNVDTGIEETIKKDSENFWYKNNGILIICEDFDPDGKEIKLWNFS